jgi:hypothetical protein
MKKSLKYLIASIIILGLVWALYSNTMSNQGQKGNEASDNSQNQINISPIEGEDGLSEDGNTQGTETTITPKPTNTGNSTGNTTTPERKLSVYIDKNNDGIKDANENLCTLCLGEQLLFGKTGNNESFPVGSGVKSVGLDATASVKEGSLASSNIAWGTFDNKDIVVAPAGIAFGDGSNDLLIPAYENITKIAGVNANISEVQDLGGETQYYFKSLVPIMQTSLDQGKTVFIKYSLNSEETKYYLASGQMSKDEQQVILTTTWNVDSSLRSGFKNVANIYLYFQ